MDKKIGVSDDFSYLSYPQFPISEVNMNKQKKPYLCGGVLLLLLEQTKPSKGTARDHERGISDDHSNPIVLRDLIYVFTGSRNYSTKKDCSVYSHCNSEGSTNVPFNDNALIIGFDDAIKRDYRKNLLRMCEFIDWHVDENKHLWLIKALLDIIKNDEDILDEDKLYCCESGRAITKKELVEGKIYSMDAFLLGVLHFILKHRAGCNYLGADTLASNSKDRKNGRDYTGSLGDNISKDISIIRFDPDAPIVYDTPCSGYDSIPNDQALDEEPEVVEAEEVPQEELTDIKETKGAPGVTIIQNQTNIEHNETKTFNIENSEVTFNL